jgi:hypothetical protein
MRSTSSASSQNNSVFSKIKASQVVNGTSSNSPVKVRTSFTKQEYKLQMNQSSLEDESLPGKVIVLESSSNKLSIIKDPDMES